MTAVDELIIQRASQLSVERHGGFGGIACAIADGTIRFVMKEAKEWTETALKVVRSAPDAHFENDEEVAKELLRRMYERNPKLKGRHSVIP